MPPLQAFDLASSQPTVSGKSGGSMSILPVCLELVGQLAPAARVNELLRCAVAECFLLRAFEIVRLTFETVLVTASDIDSDQLPTLLTEIVQNKSKVGAGRE